MTDTAGTFTHAHTAALAALGIKTKHVRAVRTLIDHAGADPDAAVAIVAARVTGGDGENKTVSFLGDDLRLLRLLDDLPLVVKITAAHYDTTYIAEYLEDGTLTREDIEAAVDLGIDPCAVPAWTRAGHAISGLSEAVADLPDINHISLVRALLTGITVSDLTWLAAHGIPMENSPLLWALNDRDAPAVLAARIARSTDAQRRLLLVLIAKRNFALPAVTAVATAVGDAPWIDTLTALILDGTDVDEAIDLARADHSVEQQRQVTMTRGGDRTARHRR